MLLLDRSGPPLAVMLAFATSGCEAGDAQAHAGPVARAEQAVGSAAVSSPSSADDPGRAADIEACPDDMQLVDGLFCPTATQNCLEHHPEFVEDPSRSERCTRFAEPSLCESETRVMMRYCIDRYEWPNRAGATPQVLVDWRDAAAACEAAGKRLCEESEWLFACEGEEMLPYTYGYLRDPTRCVLDRMHVDNNDALLPWESCMNSDACRKSFQRVDQREPAGRFGECRSAFGVFDMNGNVNEWVTLTGESAPHRGGLKGGWWGPVRSRCRPTVRSHSELYRGYEVGFRCCRNALP